MMSEGMSIADKKCFLLYQILHSPYEEEEPKPDSKECPKAKGENNENN